MERKRKRTPGWVIWFVGLPGAGKSTYAGAVLQALRDKGERVEYLSMDERRRVYCPHAEYIAEDRTLSYKLFAEETAGIALSGINVIMDGTAPERSMRWYARKLIPRFAEILIRCPLEIAINRESSRPEGLVMANIYQKALKRKETGAEFKGLGEVIGVDIPFEEDSQAECIIDSERVSVEQGRDHVLSFLNRWKSQPGKA